MRAYRAAPIAAPIALVLAGCSFHSANAPTPPGGARAVTGQIVDFQTGAAIATGAGATVSGLEPEPALTATGAEFRIADVPENSALQILATAPAHRATFSPSVIVTGADVANVQAPVVSEAYLTTLATAFAVAPVASRGIVLVHLVDATSGQARAGIPAAALAITGAKGPYFLDASRAPAPAATASSSSGWAVFFDVGAGTAALTQPATAPVTLDMPASPVEAATVTVADARVTDGAPGLPTNVSFATAVVPLFTARGCVACHAGGGAGKDLGGLTLSGPASQVYKELIDERPGIRVNPGKPEASLILTMPSRESPPDGHPNVTFTGPRDPDYLRLLVWIREGAKNN